MSDSEDEMPDEVLYIKYLPKHLLLFNLWKNAISAQSFSRCPDKLPDLSLTRAKRDIGYMLKDGTSIELTTYRGRTMYIDISGDYFDSFSYDMWNGTGSAKKIVDSLKISELMKSIKRIAIHK